MLKMGAESGTVEDSEREMINSVFSFGDKSARELMVPRREVFAVDIEDPDEEILDAVLEPDIREFRFMKKLWTILSEFFMPKM